MRDYDDFFDAAVSDVLALTRTVVDLATEIRAQFGARTPDALHIAAARAAACDVFLTNDYRLNRSIGITVEIIER